MKTYQIKHDSLEVSDNKGMIDKNFTYNLLSNTYWGKNLPYQRFEKAFNNSLCYGIYINEVQIGFARVVTDFSETASIWDVVIDKPYRNNGYGKILLESILDNPKTTDVFKWFLMTEDAFSLYERYGFTSEKHPCVMTKITKPNF